MIIYYSFEVIYWLIKWDFRKTTLYCFPIVLRNARACKSKNAFFAYFDHFKFLEFALFTNWHWYCVYSKPPSLYLSLYIYDFEHTHYSNLSKTLDHYVAWKQDQIWIQKWGLKSCCVVIVICSHRCHLLTNMMWLATSYIQIKWGSLCVVREVARLMVVKKSINCDKCS